MQKMDTAQTIQHLKQELDKEMSELRELQGKLQQAHEDATKLNQEIPQLQRKIEEDRHQIYVDGSDADKYKKRIAEIQREKLRHQAEINQLNNSFRNDAKEHSKLTR